MNKKVLFIYYSQSGQLGDIIESFAKGFISNEIQIEILRVYQDPDYTFPWKMGDFFQAMPESVLGIPGKLKPFSLKEKKYDLVVLGYQPWFLSPSIPCTSILHHPEIRNIIKDTPVVTIIGARNMWISSQEKIKMLLNISEAKLVGNIVLCDRNGNLTSLITILYWMLTGKRDKYLGIFPKPGVSHEDVHKAEQYGRIVKEKLLKGDWNSLQDELIKDKAIEIKSNLMFIETRGSRLFNIWANFIIKRKSRAGWLKVFKYYLLIALFIVAPFVLIINILIFKPFYLKQIARKKNYFLRIN